MRILVLGGDGYLGWPQALYLTSQGHDVYVVDSLVRRRFDLEHGIDSLAPIASPHRRISRCREQSGHEEELGLGLGLGLHLLNEESISTLLELAARHTNRIDPTIIAPRVDWRRLRNSVRGQA